MLPFPRTRGEGDSERDGETLDEGVLLSHSLVGEEMSRRDSLMGCVSQDTAYRPIDAD